MFKILSIVILVALLISWLFKSILRFFARSLLSRMNDVNNNNTNQKQNKNREGKVFVEDAPNDKKIKRDVGEYVDYEEL